MGQIIGAWGEVQVLKGSVLGWSGGERMAHVVIMAGGSGTRFWPRSRDHRPKQLIQVTGQHTMLQHSVRRLIPGVPPEQIMVVTRDTHANESLQQLADYPGIQVVSEPEGRDTAACIGLAAVLIRQRDPDGVMAVMPADHLIDPASRFLAAVGQAEEIARRHHVFVTFGIKPRSPSTQFGYIERGEAAAGASGGVFEAYRAAAFHEKPDLDTAQAFVESGRFYWNSGTFVWRVEDILGAIERHMPKLHKGLVRISRALGDKGEAQVIAREYAQFDKISVDYGVMEKVDNTVVLAVDYDWDDVGSWEALPRLCGTDEAGNAVQGAAHLLDTSGCIVISDEGHLVSTLGVRNLVVVHSPDATLVCRRDRSADVKELVARLREEGLDSYL